MCIGHYGPAKASRDISFTFLKLNLSRFEMLRTCAWRSSVDCASLLRTLRILGSLSLSLLSLSVAYFMRPESCKPRRSSGQENWYSMRSAGYHRKICFLSVRFVVASSRFDIRSHHKQYRVLRRRIVAGILECVLC